MLKPQDVVILFKILVIGEANWSQSKLSEELGISQSEISESLKRSKYSGLLNTIDNKVNKRSFFELIIYGLKVVFPQRPGAMVRGVPTAHSAPFFQNAFLTNENYVWPDAKGKVRGQAIAPLYKTVTKAIENDQTLYQLLALVDIIRVGKARERQMAIELLEQHLQYA
ncbi:MAG: hypothetical protein RLZZ65_1541 [Bacteroidota bacterium]|jgi:DNA-binding Lrp family transcriptional regulator